jgi:signal transduction histidine kinase
MVSKGDLGVSYLIAVGIALSAVLTTGAVRPAERTVAITRSTSLLGLCMGVMLTGGFTVTGLALSRSDLNGERVWRVAAWSTIGLGIPTLLVVGVLLWAPSTFRGVGWRSVVIVTIASGGVVGVLVGSLLELHAEHERTRTLNQRNTVFLRLFRHDIRTSVNIVRGHVELLTSAERAPPDCVEVIDDQLDHIARLSDAANRLDDLESMSETTPVDLGALAAERIDELRRIHRDVAVETEIERETYVQANDLLASVVDNLLRNAVEHNEGDPWLCVTVRPPPSRADAVELRVRDDGPGFSEAELAVHTGGVETALRHSDGVGLWLVRWITDAYGGSVAVENASDGGAVVTIILPAANSGSWDRIGDGSGFVPPVGRDRGS